LPFTTKLGVLFVKSLVPYQTVSGSEIVRVNGTVQNGGVIETEVAFKAFASGAAVSSPGSELFEVVNVLTLLVDVPCCSRHDAEYISGSRGRPVTVL
jgi:hypothetical protein